MRYLGCDIHLQVAFPQKNALPWVGIDQLKRIADNTRYLIVTRHSGAVVRGVACAITVNGKSMLYTVKHVIHKALSVKFGDFIYQNNFEDLTEGEDPVVFMRQDDVRGPDTRIISLDELHRISYIACVNVHQDESGKVTPFVSMSTDFCVKKEQLFASVSLKKGDSGGPAFAVLDDGEVRFAGTVSAGRHDRGGGNIFSFAISTGEGGLESSDDELSKHDKLVTASYYNRVRNPYESSFSDDDPSREARERIVNYIDGSDFRQLRSFVADFGIVSFEDACEVSIETYAQRDDPKATMDYFSSLGVHIEQPRKEDQDQKGWEEEQDRRKRSRFKSWKKERARKKRQAFGLFQTYAARLNGCFTPSDASAIYYETLRNGFPKHKPFAALIGFNGTWFFD